MEQSSQLLLQELRQCRSVQHTIVWDSMAEERWLLELKRRFCMKLLACCRRQLHCVMILSAIEVVFLRPMWFALEVHKLGHSSSDCFFLQWRHLVHDLGAFLTIFSSREMCWRPYRQGPLFILCFIYFSRDRVINCQSSYMDLLRIQCEVCTAHLRCLR